MIKNNLRISFGNLAKNWWVAAGWCISVILVGFENVVAADTPTQATGSPTVQARSMTVRQARRTFFAESQAVSKIRWSSGSFNIRNISVHPKSIEFHANGTGFYLPNGNYSLDLKTLGRVTVTKHTIPSGTQYFHLLFNGIDPDARGREDPSVRPDRGSWPDAVLLLGWFSWFPHGDSSAASRAQAFADALNRLSANARSEQTLDDDPMWRNFSEKVIAWRALSVKPPLSEEVRTHRVLAENAFREKNLYSAIDEYEAGLVLNPTWPEGHFNAALLCAELGFYDDAIQHMRAYVELVPDAPDTQSVLDQITIWQSKVPKD
jgi:tetratricopeptide (TPR) repeat protein